MSIKVKRGRAGTYGMRDRLEVSLAKSANPRSPWSEPQTSTASRIKQAMTHLERWVKYLMPDASTHFWDFRLATSSRQLHK